MCFRKWLINAQIRSELLVYYFIISQEQTKKEICTKELLHSIKTVHTVPAIPQPRQANPEVTFNGQWLAEKISDNIDNLIEIGLSARGIVTDNHSANVNAFSALKNIQFRMKLLYKAPAKQ